jgi:hypothetical protein
MKDYEGKVVMDFVVNESDSDQQIGCVVFNKDDKAYMKQTFDLQEFPKILYPLKMALLQKVLYPVLYLEHKAVSYSVFLSRKEGSYWNEFYRNGNRTKPVLWGVYTELLQTNFNITRSFHDIINTQGGDQKSFDYAERNFSSLIKRSLEKEEDDISGDYLMNLSNDFVDYIKDEYAYELSYINSFYIPALIRESQISSQTFEIRGVGDVQMQLYKSGLKTLADIHQIPIIDMKTAISKLFTEQEISEINKVLDFYKHRAVGATIEDILSSLFGQQEFVYDFKKQRPKLDKIFEPIIDFLTYFKLSNTSDFTTTKFLIKKIESMIDDLNDLSSYFERVFDEIDDMKEIVPHTLNITGFGDHSYKERTNLLVDTKKEQ